MGTLILIGIVLISSICSTIFNLPILTWVSVGGLSFLFNLHLLIHLVDCKKRKDSKSKIDKLLNRRLELRKDIVKLEGLPSMEKKLEIIEIESELNKLQVILRK